ncbi:unnamed protein product [Symbiodinium natans]|uniref:Uncharacterized protein n=1 Tax=Symbiodinium natans TaxID=878477 RepID=A0A812UFX2_9DINO|nr:unnamed protein product [Symbiodinium natans]
MICGFSFSASLPSRWRFPLLPAFCPFRFLSFLTSMTHYHRMGVQYQEKVRIHEVVHSAYFEDTEDGTCTSTMPSSALRQIPQIKTFDDIFISSGSTTAAILSSIAPVTRRILSPLSKTIYQEIHNKINTKMNIGQILKKIPAPGTHQSSVLRSPLFRRCTKSRSRVLRAPHRPHRLHAQSQSKLRNDNFFAV